MSEKDFVIQDDENTAKVAEPDAGKAVDAVSVAVRAIASDAAETVDATVASVASDLSEEANDAVDSIAEQATVIADSSASEADEALDVTPDASDADGTNDTADETKDDTEIDTDASDASNGEDVTPMVDSIAETGEATVAETENAVSKVAQTDQVAEATEATKVDEATADTPAKFKVPSLIKTPIAVGIAIACAIGGGAIGYFAGKPHVPSMVEKATLKTDELDTVIGQVTFNGKTTDITARQVIMLNGTLNGDEHDYPSADEVISTARNIVLEADAEARGIKVDEKTLQAFMTEMLGSDDYEGVAEQYQIDVESLKTLVKSSYISQEIRKQVVGNQEPSLVAPPATPEEGKEDVVTEEYFSYIVEAAGDEWDAKKGAWVDEKGDFAVTLGSSKTFDAKEKKASYDDALGAYQVLGGRYSVETSSYDTIWNDYLQKLLSGSHVSVYSLVS